MKKNSKKKDNRLYARYAIKRTGRALDFVWKECVIVDVGEKGIGIRLHDSEKISPGSTIYLEIDDPRELEPLCLKGTLKWIKKEGRDCIGGIELDTELEGHAWVILRGPFIYRPPKRAQFY